MPFGRPGGLRDQRHGALRRNVVHAVKIQLPVVRLLPERRIREVGLVVAAHHDVVWGVQALAFPTLRQHLDFAALAGADHPPAARLAGIEAPLGVESVAARPVRAGSENLHIMPGHPLHQAVGRRVAEHQVPVFRPGRPFSEGQALDERFEPDVGEILRPCERGKYGEQKRAGHFPAFFSFKLMLLMTCLTPFTFFASLAAFDL